VTWGIDYTTQARADLVGLDADVTEAITDALVSWLAEGLPRRNERVLAGIRFYEATVADRVIVGYTVKDEPPAFALLWIRTKPGSSPPSGP
jgi:hypothetical protein